MTIPKFACVDIETTGLDWTCDILTIAVAYRDEGGQVCKKGWVVGMNDLFTPRSPLPLVRNELQQILNKADLVTGHNMTFDLSYLYRDQLLDPKTVQGKLFDTLLLARMTGPYDSVSLESVAGKFGFYSESWDTMKGKRRNLKKLPPQMVLDYNMEDTAINLQVAEKLYAQAIVIYPDWFIRQESDFCDLMARVRLRGQAVNCNRLSSLIDQYHGTFDKLVKTYLWPYKIEGPSHHKALIRYLSQQGVDFKVRTPKGQPSVNEDSLMLMMPHLGDLEIADLHEEVEIVVKAVLDCRELEKRLSTWLEPIYSHHTKVDGRVHANFSVAGAFTYRLTANEPGVQAMPKELGIWDTYWGPDYSQAELRLGAMYAQDNSLAQVFASGKDVHLATAEMMFGLDKAAEKRKLAKSANFAAIYFSGPTTLARNVHISEQLAKNTLETHKKTFKPLHNTATHAMNIWKERGYITLLCGKRIYLPPSERERAYKAFNNLVQGGVAGVVGKAMKKLDQLGYPIVGQTHDEIRIDLFPGFDQEEVLQVMKASIPAEIQNRTTPIIEMDVDVEMVGAKKEELVLA